MTSPFFYPGVPVSASELQQLNTPDFSWLPTLTADTTPPNLGTSPGQTGVVQLNGNLVTLWFRIRFGTSPSAGSGRYAVVLPTAYPLHPSMPDSGAIGSVNITDVSAGTGRVFIAVADQPTQTFWFRANDSSGAHITHAVPWAWGAGDVLGGFVTYLTDFGV